ncbi:tail fiber protein [Shigella phage SFP17]|uniref:Tail fiber protein n=1 Tax=Shigella phage SFP17 TaxID=2692510 RepID=A0AAE6RI46_9CAUD|nr:tail fiber protein [Shigella phage SFP17]
MAIYRTGQASMDAQGYITGYETKWREQLALIRPGATIFFIDAPFQAAVISEVVSDTQIRAITTGGAEIGRSNYIILLHDSITVDGLAQDVAETLRYYQSKETQIEEAIEFFKNFDLKQLQDLANQVKGDAEKTAEDRAATEQLKNDTQQIKDSAVAETNQIKADTNAIKAQTQQIKDSAITEVNSARDQGVLAVNQTKDQAVSEMNQIKGDVSNLKNEAISARDSAQQYMTGAQSANNAAETAKNGAVTARNEAEEFAKSLDAENLLKKDANLSDLSNIEVARQNMRVGPFDTVGEHTIIYSPEGSYRLVIKNDGLLIYQKGDGTETKPFEIATGGTGATTVEGARNNLGLGTAQDVQFKSIVATDGDVLVPQARIVGCKTDIGGDKRIYLMNVGGDSNPYGWVNLLQGNWHEGYWRFGGIRGDGTDLNNVQLYMSPNKAGYSGIAFNFIPEQNDAHASGYVRSPRGFMGRCYMGGWDADANNRLTPFWADTVTRNNSGWSPIVSGGSMSDGGYYMRTSLGIISSGTTDWPQVAIHMLGDGRYHRAYNFSESGGIYSWGNDPWGGNYDFAKNPTSDRDLKHDIQYTDGKESYDRVMQWLPTMFKYNGSDIQRFGLIAQDLLKIDPQYVKLVPGSPVFEDVIGVDENGEEYIDHQIETDRKDDTLALDSNVMLTDMACAMVYMGGMIEKQQKEIDELKAAVAALLNK